MANEQTKKPVNQADSGTSTPQPAKPRSSIWEAINRDGTLAAAFRQGADEMAVALKAFPESIHVEEPGTVLNPTQGEIAASRKPARLPSPSEIARDKKPYSPAKDHDQNNDQGHGRER